MLERPQCLSLPAPYGERPACQASASAQKMPLTMSIVDCEHYTCALAGLGRLVLQMTAPHACQSTMFLCLLGASLSQACPTRLCWLSWLHIHEKKFAQAGQVCHQSRLWLKQIWTRAVRIRRVHHDNGIAAPIAVPSQPGIASPKSQGTVESIKSSWERYSDVMCFDATDELSR